MELLSYHAFLLLIFIFFSSALPLAFSTDSKWNDDLQKVEKLGEGFLKQADDICVDKEGTLYTVIAADGWVKRKTRNGEWENWKLVGGSPAGVGISGNGDLLVCDTNKGLLQVNENGVRLLPLEVNGLKIRFADDVIGASDGDIYFSVPSTKYKSHEWYNDVIEGIPHGRLLKYDPRNNETSILLDHLSFPNGVALSRDQHFLVFCETWRFRCLKHWLKGKMKGKSEIFIDNLPGGPDNINLAPDGSFWIALIELRNETKQELIEGVLKKAMVVKVGENGKIINKLDDSTGKVMAFVTSALEFEGNLYLASPNANFIGRLMVLHGFRVINYWRACEQLILCFMFFGFDDMHVCELQRRRFCHYDSQTNLLTWRMITRVMGRTHSDDPQGKWTRRVDYREEHQYGIGQKSSNT